MFLDTCESLIFPEIFHIHVRQITAVSHEASGCLLNFDTKLVRIG